MRILWLSICTLTQYSKVSFFLRLFFFLTEAMFYLECCCSSIGYLLQVFLAGLLFWHSSIQKSIVGLCFHWEHAVVFQKKLNLWCFTFIRVSSNNKKHDCRFSWLSEMFSKNFPEITLDRHFSLNLCELYLFWMLIWNIIIWFSCSIATEIFWVSGSPLKHL